MLHRLAVPPFTEGRDAAVDCRVHDRRLVRQHPVLTFVAQRQFFPEISERIVMGVNMACGDDLIALPPQAPHPFV